MKSGERESSSNLPYQLQKRLQEGEVYLALGARGGWVVGVGGGCTAHHDRTIMVAGVLGPRQQETCLYYAPTRRQRQTLPSRLTLSTHFCQLGCSSRISTTSLKEGVTRATQRHSLQLVVQILVRLGHYLCHSPGFFRWGLYLAWSLRDYKHRLACLVLQNMDSGITYVCGEHFIDQLPPTVELTLVLRACGVRDRQVSGVLPFQQRGRS